MRSGARSSPTKRPESSPATSTGTDTANATKHPSSGNRRTAHGSAPSSEVLGGWVDRCGQALEEDKVAHRFERISIGSQPLQVVFSAVGAIVVAFAWRLPARFAGSSATGAPCANTAVPGSSRQAWLEG